MKRALAAGLVLAAASIISSTSAVTDSRAASAARCPYAAPPPAVGPMLRPAGTLTIGAIGLKTPVFRGWEPDMDTEASKSLMYGPAFYQQDMQWNNSLPGQGGTVGMAGHRTTRKHPFCLVGQLRVGRSYAVIRMHYGTFVYRLVAARTLSGNDWSVFLHPWRYDPHPKKWNKGIKPEYLVTGACDPPHSAVFRINDVWKLVAEWG